MPLNKNGKNNNKGVNGSENVMMLPVNSAAAVQHLVRLSQSLLTLAEKETQALLLNDMLAFAILQYEKEKIAANYAKASEEFRARLEEFRGSDKALLARLEKLQRDLSEKAVGNNALVEHARNRAQANAMRGVKNLQEFSRSNSVRMAQPAAQIITATEGTQS